MEAKLRFVSPLERALYLRTLEPLQDLSNEELTVLAQRVRERFFRKGQTVFRRGKRVVSPQLVIEGRVRAQGAEYDDERVGPGETLGVLSLFAGETGGIEAAAEVDTTTLEIDGDDFDEVFEDHFAILHNQIRNLARRILEERKQIPNGTLLAPAGGRLQDAQQSLDLVERLLYMRRGGTFQQSNMDALITLARSLEEQRFDAGTTLWTRGRGSGFMYLILSGTVCCSLEDGTWFRAGPGYPLGNLESQSGAPRWYEAVTETPLFVMRSRTEIFIDLLEDHFEMAREFLSGMAKGLIRILEEKREAVSRTYDTALVVGSRPRRV